MSNELKTTVVQEGSVLTDEDPYWGLDLQGFSTPRVGIRRPRRERHFVRQIIPMPTNVISFTSWQYPHTNRKDPMPIQPGLPPFRKATLEEVKAERHLLSDLSDEVLLDMMRAHSVVEQVAQERRALAERLSRHIEQMSKSRFSIKGKPTEINCGAT